MLELRVVTPASELCLPGPGPVKRCWELFDTKQFEKLNRVYKRVCVCVQSKSSFVQTGASWWSVLHNQNIQSCTMSKVASTHV